MNELTDEAKDLELLMSDISEVAYCAGWMNKLEYDLWRITLQGSQPYGQTIISPQEISRLKKLSARCGGWIRFDDKFGETFVTFDEWEVLYSAYANGEQNPK